MATDWQVKRLAGALGAEVSGTDLTTTSGSDIERIKALLLEHKVLFFPGQTISPSQHVEFGHNFGELEDHPNLKNPFTDHPYIFELAATQGGVADEWHTDITFQDQPSIMSILHMVKCPDVGGDTMWTNLEQAFDELSTPMQQLCVKAPLRCTMPHPTVVQTSWRFIRWCDCTQRLGVSRCM